VRDLSAGNYIFDLKVTDNRGASETSSITIIVAPAPAPPTADAGGPVGAITLPLNSFTLDGRGSKAASGNSIVSYLWTKRSGPSSGTITNPDQALTSVRYLSAGNYIFDLKVTDNRGTSATSSITIIVASGTSNRTMATADTTSVPDNIALSVQPQLEESGQLNITVSPNPVVSDMNILIKGSAKGKTSIAIYSINGKMLQQQEFNKDGSGSVNKTVNISKLPSGIYLVQVMVDGKFRKVIKVVKQ
jgi:hypothetical protein